MAWGAWQARWPLGRTSRVLAASCPRSCSSYRPEALQTPQARHRGLVDGGTAQEVGIMLESGRAAGPVGDRLTSAWRPPCWSANSPVLEESRGAALWSWREWTGPAVGLCLVAPLKRAAPIVVEPLQHGSAANEENNTTADIVDFLRSGPIVCGVDLAHGSSVLPRLMRDASLKRLDGAVPFSACFYGCHLRWYGIGWSLVMAAEHWGPRAEELVRGLPKWVTYNPPCTRPVGDAAATRSARVIVCSDGTLSMDRGCREREENALPTRRRSPSGAELLGNLEYRRDIQEALTGNFGGNWTIAQSSGIEWEALKFLIRGESLTKKYAIWKKLDQELAEQDDALSALQRQIDNGDALEAESRVVRGHIGALWSRLDSYVLKDFRQRLHHEGDRSGRLLAWLL
ncbi:hypothetical protein NDU88_007231 [Pleurodeles waltl]|uniref:Uncharacterized protein n=1 Tax=Pleurodeles waltl TaxID=8319 RepID=A0AAV7N360_PLEWA|nr:hypothetical protein NDU88_007231 [Pleurodeles waltl]